MRGEVRKVKRKKADEKAIKAIEEFESLKKIALDEKFYDVPVILRPKTNHHISSRSGARRLVKTTTRFY